jgi:2,3-dihydroxybiphenyl 1,2-dioxygenase
MERVTQLGYLGIGVSDVDAWKRFAAHTLGLQAHDPDSDGTLFLKMDEYHHRFALHANGHDDVDFVGWEVADEHALNAIRGQLEEAGVALAAGSADLAAQRRVVDLIVFDDPDGVRTEVFYGPLVNYDRPFASPRAISGFETGTQGLGHIVLAVEDVERSIHFYRDVLGMRISDFVQTSRMAPAGSASRRMAFFHCNPRHHSVAFLGASIKPRLRHFMLQTQSLDDVGSTYTLCQDEGVPVNRTLGRHTNDHMVSFYMESPSGFEVEYGWGARTVDDSTWQVQQHATGSMWGHRAPTDQLVTAQG